MKTKQTTIDRSAAKWLPGAMALAATTASSQAAIVQITLTGNKISSTGGNELKADLTGDGLDDLLVGTVINRSNSGFEVQLAKIQTGLGGYVGAMRTSGFAFAVDAAFAIGAVGVAMENGTTPRYIACLNPITFSDPGINGGGWTNGWLQVNAFNTSATNHTVELSRLIFDVASTTRPSFDSIPGVQTLWVAAVPEPGSNLALLALGAGGLTLRRRLKRAA